MPLSIALWISVTISFAKNKLYVHKVIVQGKKLQEEKEKFLGSFSVETWEALRI